MLIKTDGDKTNMYKFTNVLGTWIRNKYNGVFVPSVRGNQNYKNIIFFNQTIVNEALGTTRQCYRRVAKWWGGTNGVFRRLE